MNAFQNWMRSNYYVDLVRVFFLSFYLDAFSVDFVVMKVCCFKKVSFYF